MTREQVLSAFKLTPRAFRNWSLRRHIDLDADAGRRAGAWRRYSYADALKLGIAVALADAGLGRGLLAESVQRIYALATSKDGPPDFVCVMPDGSVIEACAERAESAPSVAASAYIVVRLAAIDDALRVASLERCG